MIPWLDQHSHTFPPVEQALQEPNGLLAAGGDLSRERLLSAYALGIFPWYNIGEPILWWSPDPRMVLFPTDLRIRRSLAKTLRQSDWQVYFDRDFAAVINACASTVRPQQTGTWISPDITAAYSHLFAAGDAHCVSVWRDGALVGGLYGVALGGVFYGESMFSTINDASKVALAYLCAYLVRAGFRLIDCQMHTAHLASLGARLIPRQEFCALLCQYTALPIARGRWMPEVAMPI